jgi:hypothetical protein
MTISQVFSYAQQSAVQLNGRVGKIVDLLDLALVNGGPNVTCSSVIALSEVATVITATAHGFAVNDYVTISGATGVTELNGKWVVTELTSATEFKVSCPAVPDGSATGSPVVKRSPLGWGTAFTGTNARAYRPASGSRRYLKIIDTAAANAFAQGFNAMSGISTGTGPFPVSPANVSGYVWNKFKFAGGDSVQKSVTSITALNEIATVVCTGHGLKPRDYTTIAGATPAGLNGKVKVLTVADANTFTYATLAVDGAASGTLYSTKWVEVKWYLVGDATWFHLFVERTNDVYDLYSFGDLAPVVGSTVNTIVTGIDGVASKVEIYGFENAVVETIGAANKPTHLFTLSNVSDVMSFPTSTRTLQNQANEAAFLYAMNSTFQIKGRVQRLYAPQTESALNYGNWENGPTPDGYNSELVRAFKVVMGNPAYVGNVFVGISDS